MDTPQTVFFFGKPGSGKGTQAKLLAEKTGWPMYGSGDQFRAIAAEDTPAGRRTCLEMDQGLLSPPWFAQYLFLKVLFSIPRDQSVIFDGFNRKIEEAELIFSAAEFLERPFVVININVSDEEVHARLDDRKAVSGRPDDHSVSTRLEEYETYTANALDVFRKGGVVIDVDGSKPKEDIARDIEKALRLA